jgi:hypothetical protein
MFVPPSNTDGGPLHVAEKRQEEFSWVQRARGGASRTNQQSGAKRGASRNDKHSSKPTAPQGSSQVKVKTEHDRQRTASRQGVTAAKTKEGNGQSVDGHKQGSQSNPAPKPAQGAPQDSLAVGVAAQPSAHMSQSNALQPEQLKQDVTDQSTLQAKAAAAALALSSVAGVAPEDLEVRRHTPLAGDGRASMSQCCQVIIRSTHVVALRHHCCAGSSVAAEDIPT